ETRKRGWGLEERGRGLEERGRGLDERGWGLEGRGRGLEGRGRGLEGRGRGLEERGRGLEGRGVGSRRKRSGSGRKRSGSGRKRSVSGRKRSGSGRKRSVSGRKRSGLEERGVGRTADHYNQKAGTETMFVYIVLSTFPLLHANKHCLIGGCGGTQGGPQPQASYDSLDGALQQLSCQTVMEVPLFLPLSFSLFPLLPIASALGLRVCVTEM
ncbi:hypothetical protein DPEC_G00032450, partial [Dallia pectoralis]